MSKKLELQSAGVTADTKLTQNLLKESETLKQEIKQLKSRKRYGLVWNSEKEPERVVEFCKEKLPILVEDGSKQIKTDDGKPVNVLIKGDNYHALSVLNYTHEKKIDVIYIDPPYNTGNKDFIYNDNYVDIEDSYRHSKWLSFMEKRLRLARNILKDSGVIFISIDDNEAGQLKLLCDEVFGNKNFITQFIWEKTQHFGRQKINSYSNCEYILVYAKKLYSEKLKELLVSALQSEFEDAPLYNASNKEHQLTFPASKVVFNIKDGTYTKSADKKYKLIQKVVVSNRKNKNDLILSFKSRWSQATVDEEILKGATFWVKSDNFAIRVIYGKGRIFRDSPRQIIFTNRNNPFVAKSRFGEKVGTTEDGSSELKNIVGIQNIFNYPKPTSLIKYLLSLFFDPKSGRYNNDLTVLDFFAGTGTTGQAVLELNQADNGKRKFILCTNNENNICTNICYPRITKVIEGFRGKEDKKAYSPLKGNLKYFQTDFVNAEPTDRNKKGLVDKSTEMLCFKEDCFERVKTESNFRIFKNNEGKYLGVIYEDDGIEQFKKEVKKFNQNFVVYIFSLDENAREEDFEDMKDLVELKPIPSAVLNVYKRIFK